MTNMKIVTGNDLAKVLHLKNYRIMIRMQGNDPVVKNMIGCWNGSVNKEHPVYARVDTGRWIAECECGGAEIVEPLDPIFYCFSCGNALVANAARVVIFPKNIEEIEFLLLKRPVETSGKNIVAQAINAQPVYGRLGRDWTVGETVEMLEIQNKGLG